MYLHQHVPVNIMRTHLILPFVVIAIFLSLNLVPGKTASAATTIIVTTHKDELNNDGDCSLREAITAANSDTAVDACPAGNGPDVIQLGAGRGYSLHGVDNGHNALPIITSEILIEGNGATLGRHRRYNPTPFRVFEVTNSGNLTLIDMQISNDRRYEPLIAEQFGGAIKVSNGRVEVRNTTFMYNFAGTGGGAIYVDAGGEFVAQDSIFWKNNSPNGGAIYILDCDSQITIRRSRFIRNSAHDGGAILNNCSADTTIVDSFFSYNSADRKGGAILFLNATGTVRNTVFDNNSSLEAGGAIRNEDAYHPLFLEGNSFIDNSAMRGAAVDNYYGEIFITNNLFKGNSSVEGSAINNRRDPDLQGTSGHLVAHNNCITGNDSSAVFNDHVEPGVVDATYNWWGSILGPSGVGIGTGDSVGENVLYLPFLTEPASQCPSSTPIIVTTNDHELNIDGDCSLSEAITAANGDTAVDECPAGNGADTIELQDGAIYTLTYVDNGGPRTYYDPNGLPEITSIVTIRGNGAKIVRGESAPQFRMLTILPIAELTLVELAIENGDGRDGGAILNYGDLTLLSCSFSRNTAQHGGAIYTDNMSPYSEGDLTILESHFHDNVALYGGAIFALAYRLTLIDSSIIDNRASNYGGGLLTESHTFILGSEISNNQAGQGGGIWAIESHYISEVVLWNSIVSGNTAATIGGGFYSDHMIVKVINSVAVGNTAGQVGGFAYIGIGSENYPSTLTVINSSLSRNHAMEQYGGIFVKDSSPIVRNSVLWANSDQDGRLESSQISTDGYPIEMHFSVVQDSDPNDGSVPFGGAANGNIDDDPLFVRNPDDGGDGWGVGDNDDYGDLHLQVSSPAIDAGANVYLPADIDDVDGDGDTSELLPIDIDGDSRVFNGVVDMGSDEYITPQGTTENLIDDVQNLIDTGVLNNGNGLIAKLENVIAKLDQGNTTAACNGLGAFINQVNGFINADKLTPEEGQKLIDSANNIRIAIGC